MGARADQRLVRRGIERQWPARLYYVGGLPHYFAIPGRPSLVADNTGFTFRSLPRAYYTVVEQYYAAGKYWNAQSHDADSRPNNASPTSCVA